MLKRLSIIIALVCFSLDGECQPHRFFSVGSGLANSRINSITQDSDGYIWIGTYLDGAMRFNRRTQKVDMHLHAGKGGGKLLSLVNQVIDLSSLTKKHLHVEMTGICRFVEDITNSFAFMAEEKGLSLDSHSVPGTIVGYLDQDILSKILYNLISNAINYTEEGDVKVELSLEESSMLSIKVSDTGRGIPESMQNKIFERFFMIEGDSDKNRRKSSVIGLHLTSKIVKSHHGRIWLDSREGLQKCFDAGPDLIICDVLMPEMDGLGFCRKVRNNDAFRNIPVILLTARSAPAQQTAGILSGADAYLTKPFNLAYLKAMVHRFIKRKEFMIK